MGLLDGKVAIVTGGGRGIGREEALQLAAEGARVVVNDFGGSLLGDGSSGTPAEEVAAEIRAAGGKAVANTGDVADWDSARELIEQAVTTFGQLDILINNAGVIRTGMSFNTSESDWDTVIRVHLKGTFATARFAGAYWRDLAKSSGQPTQAAIVNTSSPNGLNGGSPGHVNYAVAKSALATMTIVLARELAPYGVRVNAVAPVAITRMTEELVVNGSFDEDRQRELAPASVAAVAAWLASPRAAGVSGQVLGVEGSVCRLWDSWRVIGEVRGDGPWTIAEIDANRGLLFGNHSSDTPPLGGG
jgi:NAD(P)-dependent dehydrogenase (short-subunit alcohol dehydrogenase family)